MVLKYKKIEKKIAFLALTALCLLCCADTALAQTNTIIVNTSQLSFSSAQGTPQPQTITVSSLSGSVPFSVAVASQSNWLGAIATSSVATTTGTTVQVFTNNLNSLTPGSYPGSITLTPTTGSPVIISATLIVGGTGAGTGGGYSALPTSLAFNVAFGVSSAPQQVTLSTTSALNTVTLSSTANWLQLSPTSVFLGPGTSVSFSATAIPGSLPVGTSTSATINVTPTGAGAAALQIPVTLTVGSGTGTGTGNGTLSTTVSSLSFSAATPTTAVPSQTFSINTTSNNDSVTVTPTTSTGSGWLLVNGNTLPSSLPFISQSLPGLVSVSVNPSALTAGATYTGNIAVVSLISGTVNIPVTLTVGATTGNSTISATPNPVPFTIAAGSAIPVTQTVTVNSTLSSTVTAQLTGLSWASLNTTFLTAAPGSPGVFIISVNPSGQTAGTYSATLTLTPTGGTPITVPVNITIGGAAALNATPQSLSFAYQTNTANPPAQTISLTSSASSLPFVVSAQSSGWLIVTPQSGATTASGGLPSNISVQVNPTGLGVGNYPGTITITSSGASNPTQTIPVTLIVGTSPVLQLGASGVTFSYQYGTSTQPSQQQVTVTSSGNPVTFTAVAAPGSGGNFVTVTPLTGATPQTLNISVNPTVLATLSPGTYSSNITLTSLAAGNTSVNLPVTLVIGQSTLLSVSQTSLNFNYEITQAAPAIQTITVNSTGTPLSYNVTAATTSCNPGYLTATPTSGSTPGSIAIQVATSGLIAGTCNGSVTITSPGAANSPLTIPVTVLVSNSPLLNVSPGAISITTQVGTAPANQTVSLTSTDPTVALPFNVTSTTNSGGANWLLVGPTSGSTPNNLSVGFQTNGLAVGTYTGSITVTPTTSGVPPTVIPITLTVTNNATAATSPTSLTFTQAFSGSAPASQTLAITSTTPGLSYSASATTLSGGSWLSVTPSSGTTPGTVTVSANGSGLNQGSYSGIITILIPSAANTPINVPVTLTVGPLQSLTATPTALSFTYSAGSTAPAPLTVQVASNGTAVSYTATTSSTPANLLTVTPATGNTPGTISVGFNQSVLSTLSPGAYTPTVTISSSTGGSQTITVNLTVNAAPAPSLTTLVNSASNAPGSVSPGEIITIYGTNLGPATPVGLLLANGMVTTTLGGTQVLFDNVAAPLIYVSATQINAIVPYEIAGRVTTNVVIMRSGVASSALQQRVVDSSPAIFSYNQTGSGPGAILNANSSVNTSSNPAAKGSVIQIFATGEGATNPQAATGAVTTATAPFPSPVGNVSVTIGGQPATLQFIGEAPGLVAGVLQINAVIPTTSGSGPQTIVLNVGSGTNSQQTITVAVQ